MSDLSFGWFLIGTSFAGALWVSWLGIEERTRQRLRKRCTNE